MRAAVVALAVGLLSGCTTLGASEAAEGRSVQLDVPFFPDDTDQCGPSAMASVLGYWGRPESPARLRQEIYLAHLKGSLTVDLLLAAKRHGFSSEMAEGGLEQLKRHLEDGHPLIAFVNVGLRSFPIGHYMVVTGYDDRRRVLFVHSGMKRDRQISYGKFDKQWEKSRRWALLILPVEA